MGKIHKITKNGQTIYPATTTDAVAHPTLKVPVSKLIGEINVSNLFPTGGTNGTNKYTLESAIAKIPTDLRIVGIKCSFLSDAGDTESWEYKGGTFTSSSSWRECGGRKFTELEKKVGGVGYVTCDTAAGTADKTIAVTGLTALTTGIRLLVKMANNNTASNATLNINSLGAKPLYYDNTRVSGDNAWSAGEVIDVYYNGTIFYSSNVQGGSGESSELILNWNTDVATTRLQVKQKDRKFGLKITYKLNNSYFITEQYGYVLYSDDIWKHDANWTTKYPTKKFIEDEYIHKISKSVVFSEDFSVNIDLESLNLIVAKKGFVFDILANYSTIYSGSTEINFSGDGIYYIIYNKDDMLLYMVKYTDISSYDNYYIIGGVYLSGEKKIVSVSCNFNVQINGEDLNNVIDNINGNSTISSVSQRAIHEYVSAESTKTENRAWYIAKSSMIKNIYQNENLNLSDGSLSIISTNYIKSFSPIIFNAKELRFTPISEVNSKLRNWIVIGYNDDENICIVGTSSFGWQFVNVNLYEQKFTVIKTGNQNYLKRQRIVINEIEGTIKLFKEEDNDKSEYLSIDISELLSLGANISTLTLGFCIQITDKSFTGEICNEIEVVPNTEIHTSLTITDELGDSSSLAMSQKGVTRIVKPLKGKKISILGDSISTYAGYIPSGNAAFFPNSNITNVEQTWWKKLINISEMTLEINESWSGSRISNGRGTDSMFCSPSRYSNLGNPDIIIVFGGTNDFMQGNPNCPIGEFVKKTNGEKDLQYFRQAYQFLVEKLQELYINSSIYICVPLQRNTGIWENNGEGWSQQDLWNTVKEIGEMYGINVIDLSKCGINHYNLSTFLSDGLHPNESGMNLIADYIYKEISKGEFGL